MKTLNNLIEDCIAGISEILPWDLEEKLEQNPPIMIDIREPYEFDLLHIKGAINAPRGILETACEYNYDETIPLLADARNKEVVVICRSGIRSVLAVYVMQQMGYNKVSSLKTGMKGWNDYEQPVVDNNEQIVDVDDADEMLNPALRPDQIQA